MKIQAILFDVNGTLIDILTDEGMPDIYRKISHFLSYQGIFIRDAELRDLYFQVMKTQKERSSEKYPEFDAVAIWHKILEIKHTDFTFVLQPDLLRMLPLILAQLYRAASLCRRLQLYSGVQDVLNKLRENYQLGVVTNAQSAYALPELNSVKIANYFDPIIVSGDFGYCKPDVRLFQKALNHLQLNPKNVVYVGNDMRHDILGAKQAGMKTVFFASNQGDQRSYGAEPDYIIRQFSELITAIEFLKATAT